MSNAVSKLDGAPDDVSQVIADAVLRIADQWALTDRELGEVLGLKRSTMSRVRKGQSGIKPQSAAAKLARQLVKIFGSLQAMVGTPDNGRLWVRAINHHLHAVPLEMMKSVDGLVHVSDYLEYMNTAHG